MKQWARYLTTAGRVAFGVGLLVYLAVGGGIRWSALGRLLPSWPLVLLAMVPLVMALVLTSLRLCLLLSPRGLGISLVSSLRLTLIGVFFNTCLPGAAGGDMVRMYYAARGHEGRRAEIVAVVLLDRLTGMFAMVLWPLVASLFFLDLVRSNGALRLVLGAGVFVAVGMTVAMVVAWSPMGGEGRVVHRMLTSLPGGGIPWRMLETVASFKAHRGALARCVGLSLVAHTSALTTALVLAWIVTGDAFAWSMSMLVPVGFMVNMIPLTPGGLGVGETAFDSLFGILGIDGGAEFLLAWRLVTLVVGLGGLVIYLQGRRDFVRQSGAQDADAA